MNLTAVMALNRPKWHK